MGVALTAAAAAAAAAAAVHGMAFMEVRLCSTSYEVLSVYTIISLNVMSNFHNYSFTLILWES